MSADVARLSKVMAHIETLPEYDQHDVAYQENLADGWYQGDWIVADGLMTITDQGILNKEEKLCGTTGCFAGWTVLMFAPSGTKTDGFAVTLPDGNATNVQKLAIELLGLTEAEAATLFDAGNNLEALKYITSRIIARSEREAAE